MGKWLNDPKLLTFEVKDKVAYITLNRPEKRNALSPALLTELQAALTEADDLNTVSCAVLQGAGKDFCAGYDIGGGSNYMGQEFDASAYRGMEAFDDDLWQLRIRGQPRMVPFDMFKPIIAKVQGNCLAGGTDIALMCDMVIAADDAKLGFPPTRSMGSPANHMWLYHAGPQWAKRMLFTGDSIRGRDAAKIGLVMKSVPAAKLDAEVEHLARRVSNVKPDLLAAHKRIVNLGMELMHARTLQRLAGEHDARAHQSSAFAGFKDTFMKKGLKEALRERDEPFGEGIASTDPEV